MSRFLTRNRVFSFNATKRIDIRVVPRMPKDGKRRRQSHSSVQRQDADKVKRVVPTWYRIPGKKDATKEETKKSGNVANCGAYHES